MNFVEERLRAFDQSWWGRIKMAIQTFERLQTMTYTKLDLIEKPVSNFILPWKFLINSPIIDVYLLEERMWRIPDSLRFRLSENERYLIIGVPHRFILMFMETILWCSCIFLCAILRGQWRSVLSWPVLLATNQNTYSSLIWSMWKWDSQTEDAALWSQMKTIY